MNPERRMWRTLLRVVDVDRSEKRVTLVIPAWSPRQEVWFPFVVFPLDMPEKFELDYRFHALVNIGARVMEDLWIQDVEYEGLTYKGRAMLLSAERGRYYKWRLRDKGLCISCKNPRGANGTLWRCRPCADKSNKKAKALYHKRLLYGLCTLCGEFNYAPEHVECPICREVKYGPPKRKSA